MGLNPVSVVCSNFISRAEVCFSLEEGPTIGNRARNVLHYLWSYSTCTIYDFSL